MKLLVNLLGRTRVGYALFSGVKTTLRSFARTFYVLWLEITGVVFVIFTVRGAWALFHEYRERGWVTGPQRFWTIAAFTAVSALCTLASFRRSKKMSR